MANWSNCSALNPTTLQTFTLSISKERTQSPSYEYLAGILDQSGKQKWVVSGDVSDYVSEAELDQLEAIIEALFEKAESEMLP